MYVATNTRVAQAFGTPATLLVPDFSKGTDTLPYPAWINTFERNLELLGAKTIPATTVNTKTWQGGSLDNPKFSSADITRWITECQRIQNAADAIILNRLVCGTFAANTNRTTQLFGRRK